jgi:hypothetical protein
MERLFFIVAARVRMHVDRVRQVVHARLVGSKSVPRFV